MPVRSSSLLPARNRLRDIDSLARTDAAFKAGLVRGAWPTGDARIRAVYAMAPALIPALDTLAELAPDVAVQVLLGARDAQVPVGPTSAWFARHAPTSKVDTLPNTGHYAFLAPCTWRGRVFLRALCTDVGLDRADVHGAAAQAAAQFFREQLMRGGARP